MIDRNELLCEILCKNDYFFKGIRIVGGIENPGQLLFAKLAIYHLFLEAKACSYKTLALRMNKPTSNLL